METTDLLFSALAVLFVAGVVVLDRRLGLLRAELSRLDELTTLSQKVASLAGLLERKEVSAQLEAKLTEVAESEQRMMAALGELSREVSEMRRSADRRAAERRAAELIAEQSAAPSQPTDPGTLVRDHLLQRGFDEVRLISDTASMAGNSGRVVFEAQRHGVMHKGHVHLKEGRVVDESLRAAYSTFP